MYAATLWHLAYQSNSTYQVKYDGMKNNGHCIFAGLDVFLSEIYQLNDLPKTELVQAHADLWPMASSLCEMGMETSDLELNANSLPALVKALQKVIKH